MGVSVPKSAGRAGRRATVHDIVDEKAADLLALGAVEIKQFHRALVRTHGRQIEREAPPDDAVCLEHDGVEFEGVVGSLCRVGDHYVGTATLVGLLELVQLKGNAVAAPGSAGDVVAVLSCAFAPAPTRREAAAAVNSDFESVPPAGTLSYVTPSRA